VTQQTTSQNKRAVTYLRVRCIGGSDDGVDAQLARQRDDCTRVAQQHGATVMHEYAAIGGARDVHVRSVVHTMLDEAAEDRADYIITSGFDRLFRGPATADRKLLRAIRRSGATLNTMELGGFSSVRQRDLAFYASLEVKGDSR
jgi:DNA invertase Pin-like site-specific DNA recombinase